MKKVLVVVIYIIMLIPTIVNAEDLGSNTYLYESSYGSDVKLLQSKLNEVGSCDLAVDGVFGPLTDSCVRKFQELYGLQVDGIVGPKTVNKLNILTNKTVPKNNVVYEKIPQYVMITANTLNVRKDAGTGNNIIGKVKRGTVYAVYGSKRVNGVYWYRINVNYNYGYISSKFTDDTFVLIDISDRLLTYYDDGNLLFKSNVIPNNKTKVGCYNFHVNNKNSNYLNGLVKMNSDDVLKLSSYIVKDVKVVIRN